MSANTCDPFDDNKFLANDACTFSSSGKQCDRSSVNDECYAAIHSAESIQAGKDPDRKSECHDLSWRW